MTLLSSCSAKSRELHLRMATPNKAHPPLFRTTTQAQTGQARPNLQRLLRDASSAARTFVITRSQRAAADLARLARGFFRAPQVVIPRCWPGETLGSASGSIRLRITAPCHAASAPPQVTCA